MCIRDSFRPVRVRERDRVLAAVVVADHAAVGRDRSAKRREEVDDGSLAVRNGRCDFLPTEERRRASILMLLDELSHLIDRCLLYTSDAADERSSVDLG